MAAPTSQILRDIKNTLHNIFGLKELGELTHFLGCEISQNPQLKTISLSQKVYIEKILHLADMENCRTAQIPMSPDWQPEAADTVDINEYQKHTRRLN